MKFRLVMYLAMGGMISVTIIPMTRGQLSVTVPPSTGVLLEEDVTLTCTYTPEQPAAIYWSKDGPPARDTYVIVQGAGFTDGLYNDYETGREVEIVDQASLRIKNTQLSDEGEFYCEIITNIGGSPATDRASVNLAIWVLPTSGPTCSRSPTTAVSEGTQVTLTCESSGGHPPATLSWTRTGDGPQPANPTQSPGDNTTLQVSITVNKTYHLAEFTCTAAHPAQDQPGSCRLTIDVLFAPSQPTCTIPSTAPITSTTTTLTCTAVDGNPAPTYTWRKDGTALPADSRFQLSDGGRTLMFSSLLTTDTGSYSCRANNSEGFTDCTAGLMTVQYGPENTSIACNKAVADREEGSSLECTCTTDSEPTASLTWTRLSSASLPGGVSTADSGAKLVFSSLTKNHTGDYRCTATNGIGTDSEDVSIVVRYAPKATTVTASPSATREEGESLTLTCTADAEPDVMTYSWTKAGGSLPTGANVAAGSLQISQLNRTDSGIYTCTTDNGINPDGQGNITVDVLYPPSVATFTADPNPADENSPVTLTCTVDSNPAPTVSIVRVGTGSVGDVTLATGQGRTFSHTIQSVNYTDTGTYRCLAGNGVGDAATLDLQLLVNYIPKFVGVRDKYAVAKGAPVTMTCNVTAYPTPVTFTWSKDGLDVPDTANVTNYSLGSTLSYTAVTEADYGFYNCTARNSMGSNTTVFELAAESAPEPSTDLTVTMKNSSRYVTVEWTAGFNGGQDTDHTVQYRTGGGVWQDGPQELEPASANHPRYIVTFQLPEKETYDIRVRAANGIGSPAESNVASETIEDAKTLYGSLPLTSETFSVDLTDLQSTSAVQLTNNIINELDRVFVDILGYEKSTVTGYSEGSVVAAFQSVVGESESESAQTAFTRSLTDNQLGDWDVDSSKASIGDTPPTVGGGGGDTTIIIIIAVVCAVVVVAIIGVGVFVVRRRKSANGKKDVELKERITRDDRPSLNGLANPGLDTSPDPAYAEVPSNGAVQMSTGNPYDDVHFEGDGTTAPVAGATAGPLDPNVQYATVNKNNNETPNPSTVYAQVNKKKKKDMPPTPEDPSAQYSEVKKDKQKDKKDKEKPTLVVDPSSEYATVDKSKKKKKDMPPPPEDPSAQYSEVKKDKKKDKKASPSPDVIYTEVVKDKKDKKDKKEKKEKEKKPTPAKKPAVAKKPTVKNEERLYDEVPKAEGAAAATTDENPYENPQDSMPDKKKNPQGLIYAELSDFQVKPPPKKPSKPAPPKPRYEDEPTEYASINWNASRRRAQEQSQSGSTTDDETPVTMI